MFADAGLKFEHSPESLGAMEPWRQMACTWVLTLETKAAQAVQGISWHASFVGEASAAGADDSKLDGIQRQLHSARHKNKLSKARVNVRFVVNQALPSVRIKQRPCGLMDKALVFGTKDCRFESCQGHCCPVIPSAVCVHCQPM